MTICSHKHDLITQHRLLLGCLPNSPKEIRLSHLFHKALLSSGCSTIYAQCSKKEPSYFSFIS